MTDVAFDDVAVFDCLPPDFDLDVEVYCFPCDESASSSAPTRSSTLTRRITSSVSRTWGRKLMASLKEPDERQQQKEQPDVG